MVDHNAETETENAVNVVCRRYSKQHHDVKTNNFKMFKVCRILNIEFRYFVFDLFER